MYFTCLQFFLIQNIQLHLSHCIRMFLCVLIDVILGGKEKIIALQCQCSAPKQAIQGQMLHQIQHKIQDVFGNPKLLIKPNIKGTKWCHLAWKIISQMIWNVGWLRTISWIGDFWKNRWRVIDFLALNIPELVQLMRFNAMWHSLDSNIIRWGLCCSYTSSSLELLLFKAFARFLVSDWLTYWRYATVVIRREWKLESRNLNLVTKGN